MLDTRDDGYQGRNGPDLKVLDGVASWCGGLHGSMPLSEALTALASGLNAKAAAISRHYQKNEKSPRAVSIYDAEKGNPDAPVLLKRPLCQEVLGYLFAKARSATVWFDSDLEDDPLWHAEEVLKNWKIVREVAEVVVISLSASPQQNDYIEFHFDHALSHSERLELEALVPTIVRSWGGRKPGLVTQSTADDRFTKARKSKARWDTPILSMSNPAGLSRAEFRVCVLVSHGLSIKGMCDELRLTENTVRSHLRVIYAKTGASGMADLLYRILSSGKAQTAENDNYQIGADR